MAFSDDIASGFADLLTENGRTVTYNGTDITALVSLDDKLEKDGDEIASTGTIKVAVGDVADPVYGDTVVISGDTWSVVNVMKRRQAFSVIEIIADERPRI